MQHNKWLVHQPNKTQTVKNDEFVEDLSTSIVVCRMYKDRLRTLHPMFDRRCTMQTNSRQQGGLAGY